MSVNGKRADISRDDLINLADTAGIKKSRANEMLDGVIKSVGNWLGFAEEAGVADSRAAEIRASHRTDL